LLTNKQKQKKNKTNSFLGQTKAAGSVLLGGRLARRKEQGELAVFCTTWKGRSRKWLLQWEIVSAKECGKFSDSSVIERKYAMDSWTLIKTTRREIFALTCFLYLSLSTFGKTFQ
jgi:hypothetical protein